MQTTSLRLRFSAGLSLFFFVLISLSLLMTSCKQKEKMTNPSTVQLTKGEIQKWVDKKFITPGDTTVVIRLRAVYGLPGTIYRVFAAVENKDGSLIVSSEIELGMEKGDYGIDVDPFSFAGNMEASLKDWKIWKTTQGKIELDPGFSHVRLIPADYNYQGLPLMYFKDYLINETGGAAEVTHYDKDFMIIKGLLPCPPCGNCKAPCPPPSTCNESCEPIILQIDAAKTTGVTDTTNKAVTDTTRK